MPYYKRGNTDYNAIYNECYAELSPAGKRECDEEVKRIVKACRMGRVKGIAETTAKELLVCLMMNGHM